MLHLLTALGLEQRSLSTHSVGMICILAPIDKQARNPCHGNTDQATYCSVPRPGGIGICFQPPEREKARGRARVARDAMDTTELDEMEAEREAMEELALAEFAAEAGIVLDDESGGEEETPASEDEKTM